MPDPRLATPLLSLVLVVVVVLGTFVSRAASILEVRVETRREALATARQALDHALAAIDSATTGSDTSTAVPSTAEDVVNHLATHPTEALIYFTGGFHPSSHRHPDMATMAYWFGIRDHSADGFTRAMRIVSRVEGRSMGRHGVEPAGSWEAGREEAFLRCAVSLLGQNPYLTPASLDPSAGQAMARLAVRHLDWFTLVEEPEGCPAVRSSALPYDAFSQTDRLGPYRFLALAGSSPAGALLLGAGLSDRWNALMGAGGLWSRALRLHREGSSQVPDWPVATAPSTDEHSQKPTRPDYFAELDDFGQAFTRYATAAGVIHGAVAGLDLPEDAPPSHRRLRDLSLLVGTHLAGGPTLGGHLPPDSTLAGQVTAALQAGDPDAACRAIAQSAAAGEIRPLDVDLYDYYTMVDLTRDSLLHGMAAGAEQDVAGRVDVLPSLRAYGSDVSWLWPIEDEYRTLYAIGRALVTPPDPPTG